MKRDPIVSVIIPTYNRSNYVIQAVESVLQQTMNDFEIIVVDDGSTDDTHEKIRRFGSNVNYIRTENQGAARARNVGMKNAIGRYIAYLDSDDLYNKFKLEIQSGLLERCSEIGLVYSESSAFDEVGYFDEWHLKKYHCSAYERGVTYDNLFSKKQSIQETKFIVDLIGEDYPEWLNRYVYFGNIYDTYLLNLVVFTPSIMFRRSALKNVGLQEQKYGLFHDLEFVLRICKHYPVAFIDLPIYQLRYHSDQISTAKGQKGAINAIKKQRDLLQVLKDHGLRDLNYYRKNDDTINRQLARLHRAVAIPLLSYNHGSFYQHKNFSKRARKHLGRCAALGQRECYLSILSYLPHFLRRIGFIGLRLKQKLEMVFKPRRA
jgi:glycosyltransferase involved in cell wall biosynthesis